MAWRPTSPQAVLRLVAVVVLLAGWGTAAVVYLAAEEVPEAAWVEQVENSRVLRRQIEILGGKLNLLSHDLSLWCDRHCHGRAAWLPIAVVTGLTSLVLVVIADQTQHEPGCANTQGNP